MTNPTPQQILAAWEAIEGLDTASFITDKEITAIREALPPKPLTYEELQAKADSLELDLAEATRKLEQLQQKLDAAIWDADVMNRNPQPEPLPNPQDAKPGDYYLVTLNGGSAHYAAERMPEIAEAVDAALQKCKAALDSLTQQFPTQKDQP